MMGMIGLFFPQSSGIPEMSLGELTRETRLVLNGAALARYQ